MIGWAILAVLPLVVNLMAAKGSFSVLADAIGLSAMLALLWALVNMIDAVWTLPSNKSLHPVLHLAMGALIMCAWRSHRERWKLVLAGCYLAQCSLHAAFWLAWAGQPSQHMLFLYVAGLNVLFACQVAVLAWPAGLHVARGLVAGVSWTPGLGGDAHARKGPLP